MGGLRRRLLAVLGMGAAFALPACAGAPPPSSAFRLVPTTASAPGDARVKIEAWQARAQGDAGPPAALPEGSLGARYQSFVAAERRELAERVRAWIQAEAERSYRPDLGFDQWPTFREVLGSTGDDCDGLELLALHALRALGFPDASLYRAVIERRGDGTQHMVTLWLESPERPLVIDPTGFATRRLLPLADLDAWQPKAVFNERAQYSVDTSVLAPASPPD